MPCIKGVHPKFVADLAEAGQYVAAGLPNITGNINTNQNLLDPYGAFYWSGELSSNYTHNEKAYNGNVNIMFAASRSNPIYGNSDTVQPPALTCLLGEYVVGSVAVVGEADAESLLASVTQLEGGKAETDASNFSIVGRDLLAGLGMPGSWVETLALAASGSNYTAPTDGFFVAIGHTTGEASTTVNGILLLESSTMRSQSVVTPGNYGAALYLPVRRGDVVNFIYNMYIDAFKFVHAEGSANV
jgi:hypothetical protein